MDVLRPLSLAVLGTVGLLTAALAQPPAGQIASPAGTGARSLTSADEEILRSPFPSDAASARLMRGFAERAKYRRWLASLPPDQRPKIPDSGGMGWSVPDAEYWQRIPPEARAIPTDWSSLAAVRFNNTQVSGEREIRLSVQGDYDLWLLSDPLHDLTACISVHRPTRRVWFMEITRGTDGDWVPKRSKDPCYACHPSGPRVLRPLAEPGIDRERLALYNRRILSYGACDFGDTVDRSTRGQPYENGRCSVCHNGIDRGRLYDIHQKIIQFKTQQDETMPPRE